METIRGREVEKVVPHQAPNDTTYSADDYAKLIIDGKTYYAKVHTPNGIYKRNGRWYWEMEGGQENDIPVTGSFIDGGVDYTTGRRGQESRMLTVMEVYL